MVFILLASTSARAQIINLQSLIEQDQPEGFSGLLEGASDWRTGNNQLLLISGNLLVSYLLRPHRIFFTARGEFGSDGGNKLILNSNLEHLRYRFERIAWIYPEVFLQHGRNNFVRIAERALWGAGPRFPIIRSDRGDLAMGLAYMMEYERLTRDDGLEDSGRKILAHRLSSYISGSIKINDVFGITDAFFAQPRIDRYQDARFLSETEFLVEVTGYLSIKVELSIAYDTRPPQAVRRLDTKLIDALQLRF